MPGRQARWKRVVPLWPFVVGPSLHIHMPSEKQLELLAGYEADEEPRAVGLHYREARVSAVAQ